MNPFYPAHFQIPAFTFEFYDVNSPDDKKHEITTEPIDIEVTSLLGEQRAQLKIADIEGVVEMPAKPILLVGLGIVRSRHNCCRRLLGSFKAQTHKGIGQDFQTRP